MGSRKFVYLFTAMFAIVAIFFSCTPHQQATIDWPSTLKSPVVTTKIEVLGNKGEKLSVTLDPKTGECVSLELDGEKKECNDKKIATSLVNTYFCIPPEIADQSPNADIDANGEKDMYCGKVTYLPSGTDVQIKSRLDPEAGNRKCKVIGGNVFCYPPVD